MTATDKQLARLSQARFVRSIEQQKLPASKAAYDAACAAAKAIEDEIAGKPPESPVQESPVQPGPIVDGLSAGDVAATSEQPPPPQPESNDARERRLRALEGADLSKLTDDQLVDEAKELEAFCTSFDEPRKAECRRRQIEVARRSNPVTGNGASSAQPIKTPQPAADGDPSPLQKALFWTQEVHYRCGPECKSAKGRITGAWAYLESKGIDPSVMPASVVCRPYLFGARGALLGLATDDDGTVLLAEAILITREGLPAEWHGSNKVKRPPWGKPDKDGKRKLDGSWWSKAAVRMAARNGNKAAPIVLCEGVTTALAIWQSIDSVEVWALLGSKRWAVISVPADRELILAIDADGTGNPGREDTLQGIAELKRRRSFKVARPEGSNGYDWCDVCRDKGPLAVAAGIAAAEVVEHQPAGEAEVDASDKIVVPIANHVGRARKFVAIKHEHLQRWRDDFYDYDAGRYVPAADEVIRANLYRFLDGACHRTPDGLKPVLPNIKLVNETLSALRAVTLLNNDREAPCWLDRRKQPNPEDLICFPNGILNLQTAEFMPPDPALFTLGAVAFDYVPDAPPPVKWLKFLDEVFDHEPEQIDALQEMFGYYISPDTSFEKAYCWIGPKRGGKDTMRRMLCELLPTNATCGPTLASLATDFGLEPLIGKQACIIGDMRLGSKVDKNVLAENLLKLTGRSLFTIARKYKAAWHGILSPKLLLISNERPNIPDTSGAVASRLIWLLTRQSFYGKEDRQLFARDLRPEASSVLRWALDGLSRARKSGKLLEPGTSVEEQRNLERLGSPVLGFVSDCCSLDDRSAETTTDDLHEAFKDYAAANDLHPISRNWFGRNLKSATGERAREIQQADGTDKHGYRGIRITNPSPKRPADYESRRKAKPDSDLPF
jgi:P4 family phage/plasmid primase-like protien